MQSITMNSQRGMRAKDASRFPGIIDRETLYAKLQLFSSVVELLENRRADFDENAHFALSILLGDLAKEVCGGGRDSRHTIPAKLLMDAVTSIPACKTPGDRAFAYDAALRVLGAAGWIVEEEAVL